MLRLEKNLNLYMLDMNIFLLPKEIIDLIYEFNPEHREKYKNAMQDIKNTVSIVDCDICGNIFYLYNKKKIYINSSPYLFCSRNCQMNCLFSY